MTRVSIPFKLAASVAALVLAASSAQAQRYYITNFDSGTDIVNNNGVAANYNIYTASSPVQPLDGLNGWGSNDSTFTTGTPGTSAQLVGRSDYVGSVGSFFGGTNAGALGGIYRTNAGSGAAPDVVPSTTSGGIVSLYHTFSLSPTPTTYSFNVDFTVTSPGAFATNRDTFAFTLANSTGNLLTINFAPNVNSAAQDVISTTIGGTTNTTSSAIILNAQYHMGLTINVTANTYSAVIQGQTGGTFTLAGSLAGSTIAATAVDRAGVLWNLADKTATAGAYQAAGSNYIAFDNFAVPEPSTYAMMVLGFLGLGLVLRVRHQQA